MLFPQEAFAVFASSEHFSQKSVHDVFQDRRGFLWFATQDGVVRHDGYTWRKFGVRDGLSHPHVWKISERHDGALLFGTAGGGVSVFADRFSRWSEPGDDVRAFLVEGEAIFCATSNGLFVGERRLTTADGLPSNEVLSIQRAKDGVLWVGTAAGLVCLHAETLAPVATPSLPAVRISALCEDGLGSMWIGTWGSGAFRVDEKKDVRAFSVDAGLANNQVMCARRDRNGDVWLGTWGGGVSLVKQRAFGGRAMLTTINDGLGNNNVRSIFQDSIGRMWIGSGGAGVTCITLPELHRGKVFRSLTTRDGLARNMVACIAQDKRRRLWFGTFAGGVSCFDPDAKIGAWRTYTTKDGLGSDTVRAGLCDAQGRLWFGTTGGGVSRLDPSTSMWRTFNRTNGLASDLVRCLCETDDGRVWAGTDGGGLACFETSGAIKTISLPNEHVFALLAHGRHLYCGTMGGGIVIYDRNDGSISQLQSPSQHIMSFAMTSDGRLWCGTNGDGLLVRDGESWRRFTTTEGLPHDVVYALLTDNAGALYGSTTSGVFRLSGDSFVSFDTTDGLADDECNAGAALADATSRLWFGTIGGASSFAPSDVPTEAAPSPVYITDLRVRNGYEYVFEYAAVEYDSPSKVRFRCKLEPLEHDWLELTKARSLRYTNLAPGEYTFHVAARNWSGVFSEPATLKFKV